jgi:hypothetical protein
MKELIAEYEIQRIDGLVVKRLDGEASTFTTKIDRFQVTITLTESSRAGVRAKTERLMTRDCFHIKICVSSEESEAPEPPIQVEQGKKDFTSQAGYFATRTKPYGEAAAEVLNRVAHSFRYHLHQPFLGEVSHTHGVFQNPRWVDETGSEM